jgi:hypothetical protein
MSQLNAEQSAVNERLFGLRYLTIEAQPEKGNRAQRRAAKKRKQKGQA